MNRNKKLLWNTTAGIVKQITVTICGFILPRFLIMYYGSSVNGLISSIAHFLSFVALLEMGIGPVIQANLYKPLAEKNVDMISQIVKSAERFYRRIAMIIIGYTGVLVFFMPLIFETEYDWFFTGSLIVIISISTVAQYFFGATYQSLLNADQKAYVQLILQILTILINTIGSIVLIKFGVSIQMVKLLTALVFLIRPFGQMMYVKKNYSINKNVRLIGEPIKQKWNGFAQHLSTSICENIDVVLLTFFSNLQSISIYSVYYSVTFGITSIIMTAAGGLESFFGNMIVKNENKNLYNSFSYIEWLIHSGVSVIFSTAATMILPFVALYTDGVHDAKYIQPVFSITMILAYAFQCLRIPYFRLIKAAGHFKETQNGSFISTGINLVLSIVLLPKLGLVGIAIGTLVAMLFHTLYFVYYLSKNILYRKAYYFIKNMLIDIVVFTVTYFVMKFIITNESVSIM
ncbi:polysaccharide biosynthesis C-terminal domain-containing protein, partial [Enterococcus faecium]|nr:polysaccharide biosynthesis C-terminal domain-containing protein [Enterococcus faecium]